MRVLSSISSLLASFHGAGTFYAQYQRKKVILSQTQLGPLRATVMTGVVRHAFCSSSEQYERHGSNQPLSGWI